MVLHCHGTIDTGAERNDRTEGDSAGPSPTVLTDSDYNCWYLSSTPNARVFQLTFEVILQSNPLVFVGYSLSDFDIVRVLRQLSLRRRPGREQNIFAFVDYGDRERLTTA
jgi:hypothetical protein